MNKWLNWKIYVLNSMLIVQYFTDHQKLYYNL